MRGGAVRGRTGEGVRASERVGQEAKCVESQ